MTILWNEKQTGITNHLSSKNKRYALQKNTLCPEDKGHFKLNINDEDLKIELNHGNG